jgi:hypothetical protein
MRFFAVFLNIAALMGQTAVATRMGLLAAFMTSEPCDIWQ